MLEAYPALQTYVRDWQVIQLLQQLLYQLTTNGDVLEVIKTNTQTTAEALGEPLVVSVEGSVDVVGGPVDVVIT